MFHEEKFNLSGFVHVAQDNIQYEKIPNKHANIETGRVHQVNEENNSKFRSSVMETVKKRKDDIPQKKISTHRFCLDVVEYVSMSC